MTSAKNNPAEPGIVVSQYETLRKAALGDALPPDARAGLMLFLRRGMWGWACALATTMTPRAADRLPANGLESAGGIPNRHSHLCSHGH